jgi:hypothetical protein
MLYENDECQNCHTYINYSNTVKKWRCEICKMVETPVRIDGIVYNCSRYKLKCGHNMHGRCYDKWCKIRNKDGCVLKREKCITCNELYIM